MQNLQVGDRGWCRSPSSAAPAGTASAWYCLRGLYSNCHNVNPNATAVGGIYGYSHTTDGYDGGQSRCVRVPFADVGPSKIPDWMTDEDAVLLTDMTATGYFGAHLGDIVEGDVVEGDIVEGDVVLVFGAGPVGLVAAKSAWLMGAGRVISIDHLDHRLVPLQDIAEGHHIFSAKLDGCIKPLVLPTAA